MKKLLYMLCISTLVFTGCNKFSPDAGGEIYAGLTNAEMIAAYCKTSQPGTVCSALEGKTEMTLNEAKPVMKLVDGGKILHGVADLIAWDQGFFNVKAGDGPDIGIAYIENFSVESGSMIPANTSFRGLSVWKDSNGNWSTGLVKSYTIAKTEGGNKKGDAYDETFKGVTVSRVAVFDDLKKYVYLPQLHFAL